MHDTPHKKLRRAHTKSRNGCTRCKRQRKKCDEALPRCTRCTDLDIDCQYQQALKVPIHSDRSPQGCRALFKSCTIPVGDISFSNSDWTRLKADLRYARAEARLPMLDTKDLELFKHYLAHTSRIIPFDEQDSYVLQVGFPRLALRNNACMSSILALSAACLGHDLLFDVQQKPSAIAVSRVQDLLSRAELHHKASLKEVRNAISTTEQHEGVLASAALMVLYASASHSLRIRLVEAHESISSEPVPRQYAPDLSQWIYPIRAANFAYMAIATGPDMAAAADSPMCCELGSMLSVSNVIHPQGGPSHATQELFLPIVASTSGFAIKHLRARACRVADTVDSHEDLQACWDAIDILDSTMSRTLPGHDLPSTTESVEVAHIKLPDEIATWLRDYIARVTFNEPTSSNPLRRSIPAFLNRVPAAYVSLVQDMLDCIPSDGRKSSREGSAGYECWEDSPIHRLAVDVFAHWLVLVMLLDGVWWIGETGAWELGRVIAFMERIYRQPEAPPPWAEEDAWWPKSMYLIRVETRKHTVQ